MSKKEISKYYIDEHIARLIAAQVIVLIALALVFHWVFILLILTIDFALRAFTYYPSPLALSAKIISRFLNLKPKLVFAAPKKFAAGVGFVFTLVIFILAYFNYFLAAYVVGGILIIFAVLESLFKICMGCYVYNWIVAPMINKRNNKIEA